MLLPLFAAKEVASDRGNEMHAVQCIAVQREEQPASYLILNPSTDHALSAAHCSRKNLMFIGVSNKLKLLLPSDSLLIRCACVLIGDASVQAHRPYLILRGSLEGAVAICRHL